MACVNITGSVSRTGSLTGACTLQVAIARDGVTIATVPIVTPGAGVFPYSYQDNAAVSNHTYTATVQAGACGCMVSSAGVNWTFVPLSCTTSLTLQSVTCQ